MRRWHFAVAFVAALAFSVPAFALDGGDKDKEELRTKILKKVEDRLKEENKRVLDEVKKILDEELAKLGGGEEEQPKPPVKKDPPPVKKDPVKKDPVKKDPVKKDPPKNAEEPGYLGVVPDDLTESMRKLLKLGEGEGVLMVDVAADGPAAKAGLKANDILLEVNGEGVGTSDELREAVQSHKAGETLKLSVLRKKEKLELKVKLVTKDSIAPMDPNGDEGDETEGDEGDEGDEKDETPVKKPKVVFEPRVEAPKYSEKTAEELRDEIRKFLDETLKADKPEKTEKPKTKKLLLPGGHFNIADGDEGDEAEEGDENDETPAPKSGKEVRELTKRFLKDLLDRLEKADQDEEDGTDESPFNFDDEMKKMMEKFKGFKAEEFEKLREQLKEQMGKLQDDEYLKKLMEGMNPEQLQEQLQKLLKGMKPGQPDDDEDLTEPEDGQAPDPKKDPAPKEDPKHSGRAWLGVAPEELSDDMLKQLRVEKGVLVREVVKDSPAEQAGLKEGDVLLSIDGEELGSPEDLQKAIAARKAGADVTLSILRKGKRVEKQVTLAARKKISIDLAPSTAPMLIGDGRGDKKAKKEKNKKEKKATAEEKEFNPAELGMEFAKKQGFRFAVLDKNGKVILSQPMENLKGVMEMARKFGFEMPSAESERPLTVLKNWSGKAPAILKNAQKSIPSIPALKSSGGRLQELFLRGGDKDGKNAKKNKRSGARKNEERQEFRMLREDGEGGEGCEDCPLCKLMHGNGGKGIKDRIEKFLKSRNGGEREFEFKVPAPKGKNLKNREYRFEFGAGKNKPAQKVEGDGKAPKAALEKMRKELEKAMKESGGKKVPNELKDELQQLEKELKKLKSKHHPMTMAS